MFGKAAISLAAASTASGEKPDEEVVEISEALAEDLTESANAAEEAKEMNEDA